VPADTTTQTQENRKKKKRDRRSKPWKSWKYSTRLAVSFALVSVMTILVSFGVLSIVWSGHFQSYTHDNLQSLADTTASQVAENYEDAGNWSSRVLAPASSAAKLNKNLGVRIVDQDGTVRYDTDRSVYSNDDAPLASRPDSSSVRSDINTKDGSIGYVEVWVYGSNTLLTQADRDFRNESYRAMLVALVLAVIISLVISRVMSRNIVRPVNRITRTARALKEGDLTARTRLSGDDEISRLGETFDKMADAIEKDREMERRLTTDVAHELRTPLMAIQSTVEAMVDGVFEPDAERLGTVNAEVQRLSRLVDALLKLSRLENRKIPMNKQKLNLGDLIETIVSTHEAFVRDSGLNLVFNREPDVYVYGDPDMLRQATANLISNAVRYTEEGTITVTVRKSQSMAEISVADTGIGLSPEEAKMVFARFWRADAGRNRAQGGLGVGLSVVKEIVDRHNGWVRVEGKKGEGSTFTINIPLYDETREKKHDESKDRDKGERTRRGIRRETREESHE
jgi:two-component system sensor histidine kinase BaeS